MNKKNILIGIMDVVIILLFYYLLLPPLNLSSPDFWSFAFLLYVIIFLSFYINSFNKTIVNRKFELKEFYKHNIMIVIVIVTSVMVGLINFFSTPLFNAKEYSERIVVNEDNEFVKDVKEVDFSKIPLLDKASSQKLGDRKMGEATDWVSQFYVSDLYTQINYNNEIVRVTPIEYDGIIKYFTNRKEGIKGYIVVDSVSGESRLEKINKGMKYMPSAYFFENLERKIRFKYPTTIFDEPTFEIDNEGNPYWIIPTVKYKAIGLKKEIDGAILLNAVTGESKKYKLKDVPSWVDHVYSADLIIEQVDDWGSYKKGFFNSIFGQKGVVETTDGYNYLVMDDDVYLYTGITSVVSDASNLGFILVNLRTKETNYYSVPGAEEFSAMASAKGLVQEKNYDPSFPLLINLNNKPTYLLSLKDASGLVKMYAFIDVKDYQKVVVSDASLGIEVAAKKYLGDSDISTSDKVKSKVITIKNIDTAVIDGNTNYYIIDSEGNFYTTPIKTNKSLLPFLKTGDKVSVDYNEDAVSKIVTIEKSA